MTLPETPRRPNIVLLLSDEERQRRWLGDLPLPARQRMLDAGMEFTRFYTNTVPCSPARASLITGRHIWDHGVTGNVGLHSRHATGTQLPTDAGTIGHWLRDAGYRTSYIGKWHLSVSRQPDLEAFGFSDWSGDDLVYRGMPASGLEEDEGIADEVTRWLSTIPAGESRPWFLAVNFINPHDILWYPLDQRWFQEQQAEITAAARQALGYIDWRPDPVPPVEWELERIFTDLPANFADDLATKPGVHQVYRTLHEQARFGRIELGERSVWCRLLDYYYWLHLQHDVQLGRVLDAVDQHTSTEDTVVIFTSDHGDMAGAHGLRGKGPFVYEENVNIPLYVRGPEIPAGTRTDALASHLDLTQTLLGFAGAPRDLPGVDLSPVLADPTQNVRDWILFGMDRPYYTPDARYALRGMFDGRTKFARYYGYPDGPDGPPTERSGPGAAFEHHDIEWYDLDDDPLELRNLAAKPEKGAELRERFEHLRSLERTEIAAHGMEVP